jgi:hypothetical protein
VAWLVGTWEGTGVAGYPSLDRDQPFGQRVEVVHDARPFLGWHSRTWAIDEDGRPGRPLATEVGFWRVTGDAVDRSAESGGDVPVREVELLLAHATGIVEMYVGRAAGARIDVATDVVARSRHAVEYSAATRVYGLVEGDLLWAMDMAAVGRPRAPHASARLRRSTTVPGEVPGQVPG